MDYVSKMHKNTYSHHFAYNFPEFIKPLKEFMNPKFGNSTLREHVRVLGRLGRRGKVLKGISYFSFTIALLRWTVYRGVGGLVLWSRRSKNKLPPPWAHHKEQPLSPMPALHTWKRVLVSIMLKHYQRTSYSFEFWKIIHRSMQFPSHFAYSSGGKLLSMASKS